MIWRETNTSNKWVIELDCTQWFRKLSKEKLQEMLLEREDNDVLINKL